MNLDQLWPAAGVVLGWFLNEASQYLRIRSEARKPIAQALAEILEIRFSAILFPKACEQLRERLGAPQAEWAALSLRVCAALPPHKGFARTLGLPCGVEAIDGAPCRPDSA